MNAVKKRRSSVELPAPSYKIACVWCFSIVLQNINERYLFSIAYL